MEQPPQFIIIGGGNGSGKSTSAAFVLPAVIPYINADEIAKALPEAEGENKDVRASRILLNAMDEYESQNKSFAIETTLASRSLAPRVRRLQERGYQFQLLFFWLSSPEMNIHRVAKRVLNGGHHIPEDVIRRRYVGGLKNLFSLYLPLADIWQVYDNTVTDDMKLVAAKEDKQPPTILLPDTFSRMKEIANNE